MTRRWSLRTRFVLAATACLLPLLGVTVYVLYQSLQHNREQLIDTEIAVSEVVATGLAGTLAENQDVLERLAQYESVRDLTLAPPGTGAKHVLTQSNVLRPSLNGMFVTGPDGSITDWEGLDPNPLSPGFSAAVLRTLSVAETGVSGRLAASGTEGGDVIALTVPIQPEELPTGGDAGGGDAGGGASGAAGQPLGVLGALISVDRLEATFLPFASGDTAIAILADGQVIASGAPDRETGRLRDAYQEFRDNVGREFSYDDATGATRLGVVSPVAFAGVDWAVLVSNPSPTTYGPNRQLLQLGIAALVVAVLATLGLAFYLGERTARPLRRLTAQAAALARGDFTPRVDPTVEDVTGGREVHKLAAAFREMAGRLAAQVEDLETGRGARERQAAELRDLNRRTIRLQEDERRRIAAEIHDAVSPLITGALYHARALALTNGATKSDERDAGLAAVGDLLARASDELHGVVFALRPPDLDDLGVAAAIERYIGALQLTDLTCRVEVVDEPPPLSPEVRIGVYRIVQEALHNVVRHAGADEAVVVFETAENRLRVSVRDNGAGFNPAGAMRPTSLGLLSMQERAAAIGATLEIVSATGLGTAIVLERPLGVGIGTDPSLPAIPPLDDEVGDRRFVIDANGRPMALAGGSR